MESTGDVEYFLLDLFGYLLVDRTRSRPELHIRRLSGAQFEASATKEQRVALQCGDAQSPPYVYRVIDPFRPLLSSKYSQQSPVQRDHKEGMNSDAFSLAALLQRIREF